MHTQDAFHNLPPDLKPGGWEIKGDNNESEKNWYSRHIYLYYSLIHAQLIFVKYLRTIGF